MIESAEEKMLREATYAYQKKLTEIFGKEVKPDISFDVPDEKYWLIKEMNPKITTIYNLSGLILKIECPIDTFRIHLHNELHNF